MNLEPLIDESIHSLLFRHYMVFGINAFKTIIDKNGYFRRTPWIEKGTGVLDFSLHEPLVAKLFAEKQRLCRPSNVFGNPLAFFEEMRFFYGKQLRFHIYDYHGRYKVRFCPQCIKESINERGYGYLKTAWLVETNCEKHGSVLTKVDQSSLSKCVSALKTALSGKEDNISEDPKYKEWRDVYCIGKPQKSGQSSDIHLAPCLRESFLKVILSDEKCVESTGRNNLSNAGHERYLRIISENLSLLEHFFISECDLKEFNAGIIQCKSFSVKIRKKRNIDCRACYFEQCPLNTTFMRFVLSNTLSDKCEYAFEVLNDYLRDSQGKLLPKPLRIKTIKKMKTLDKLSILKDKKSPSYYKEPGISAGWSKVEGVLLSTI